MTIVIGAGISGLFASTVLCKHGHQITLLDQDNSEERKKINQRFHTPFTFCFGHPPKPNTPFTFCFGHPL